MVVYGRRHLPMYLSIRFCIAILVPCISFNFGRIIPGINVPTSWNWASTNDNEDSSPNLFDIPAAPNYTSSQYQPRFRRQVDLNPSSTTTTATITQSSISLFGVGFEYDTEKRNIDFDNGLIRVLESSVVTIRLFGIFENGSRMRIAKNGFSCDGEDGENELEYNILFEKMSARPSPHVVAQYNYTFGRVVEMTLPKRSDYPKIYFCIYDPTNDKWLPQGTGLANHIELTTKMLPIWFEIILIVALLALSGLFSGLNLGLMSLNKTDLKIIMNTGEPYERQYAAKIAPVRNHGNFLLCCLLFSNVLVNATLTILMDGLTSGIFAIVFSTLAIVIFGEIIPQAICSRHGLAVGAKTIYITKFFMLITFPLAYPLSLILDKLLGEEIGSVYTRERLKELLKVTKDHHGLETEEVALISGALEMKTKTVRDIMTKLEVVFMLPLDATLDYDTISEIEFQGYTRIPVYDKTRNNVVAVLNVKQLTLLDASDNIPVRTVVEYYQNSLFYVFENTRLDYMFRAFREGNRGHMAFVQRVNDDGPGDPFYETIGVVTMEDVLEELLQADIFDETDVGKFKARLDKRKRPTDIPFLSKKKTTPTIGVPPPLALAACQFLTTAVPAFGRNYISENILNRLVKTTVTLLKPSKFSEKDNLNSVRLYESGKPSDLFIMVLEGRVEVEVGNENLTFQAGPFQCFGSEFLLTKPSGLDPETVEKESIQLDSPSVRKHSFVPDYTVGVLNETFFMKVRYGAYCAARVATELERKYTDPKEAHTNQNWRKEVEEILTAVDENAVKHHRRMVYDDSLDEETDTDEPIVTTALLHPSSRVNGDVGDVDANIAKGPLPVGENVRKKTIKKVQVENPSDKPDA